MGPSICRDAGTTHPRWRRCGSFGTLSCFSFYANKLITTGEGGMVLTDDPKLAEKARSLRNLCFQANRRFYHEELGFNFRLTNMQAALGLAQSERIEEIIARKRWIGPGIQSSPRRYQGFAVAGGGTVGPQCLLDVRCCPLRRDRHGRGRFCTEAESAGDRDPAVFPGTTRTACFSSERIILAGAISSSRADCSSRSVSSLGIGAYSENSSPRYAIPFTRCFHERAFRL